MLFRTISNPLPTRPSEVPAELEVYPLTYPVAAVAYLNGASAV